MQVLRCIYSSQPMASPSRCPQSRSAGMRRPARLHGHSPRREGIRKTAVKRHGDATVTAQRVMFRCGVIGQECSATATPTPEMEDEVQVVLGWQLLEEQVVPHLMLAWAGTGGSGHWTEGRRTSRTTNLRQVGGRCLAGSSGSRLILAGSGVHQRMVPLCWSESAATSRPGT